MLYVVRTFGNALLNIYYQNHRISLSILVRVSFEAKYLFLMPFLTILVHKFAYLSHYSDNRILLFFESRVDFAFRAIMTSVNNQVCLRK